MTRPSLVRPGLAWGRERTGQTRSGPARPGLARLGQAWLCIPIPHPCVAILGIFPTLCGYTIGNIPPCVAMQAPIPPLCGHTSNLTYCAEVDLQVAPAAVVAYIVVGRGPRAAPASGVEHTIVRGEL